MKMNFLLQIVVICSSLCFLTADSKKLKSTLRSSCVQDFNDILVQQVRLMMSETDAPIPDEPSPSHFAVETPAEKEFNAQKDNFIKKCLRLP
jgi:hypothetical protein